MKYSELHRVCDGVYEKCVHNQKALLNYKIPCEESKYLAELQKYKNIITLEEHRLEGGIGSYTIDTLSDNRVDKDVYRFGISNGWCYRYGGREDNRAYHSLDEKTLLKEINKIFKK